MTSRVPCTDMALYDDEVLYVVPGSHARLNTAEENAQLADDDSVLRR